MSYREDIKMLKALADENRLAVLELLKDGEKCACVLLEKLSISQSTLSHHMKILCDSGIVDYRKDGVWIHYSISEEGSKRLREKIEFYTTKSESAADDNSCCCK